MEEWRSGGCYGALGGAEYSLSHIDLITEDISIEALSLAGLKLSAVLQHVCACVTWFAQGEQTGRIAGHGTPSGRNKPRLCLVNSGVGLIIYLC